MGITPLAIKEVPFFKGLSQSEIQALKTCLREKTFQKGETLFIEGSLCSHVFFIKTGRVKICRIASSGREQTLETLGPGDTCACNPGSEKWHCSSTSVAMSACTVWFLSRANYVQMVQTKPKVTQALNQLFAQRLQCFSALIEDVSLKDSQKRLIKFIVAMLKENQGSNLLTLSFTREELAQRIGVARETVARQLRQLKDMKLIEIKPHQIIVRDRTGLEQLL